MAEGRDKGAPTDFATVLITFKGLSAEFPEITDYDVTFRRMLGVKVEVPDVRQILSTNIFTTSTPVASRLRLELDAGQRTPGKRLRFSTYNASLGQKVLEPQGVRPSLSILELLHEERRSFVLQWMFFNAWCSCYREEINAMVEHPMPVLGYSNSAHFKTSDEANAVSWLRAMFVYANERLLHFGRAIPREWFLPDQRLLAHGVSTRYGDVSIEYRTSADRRRISARVDLRLRIQPPCVLVRFRHPEGLPLRAVRVNGAEHSRFDPLRNDVDITGYTGEVVVDGEF